MKAYFVILLLLQCLTSISQAGLKELKPEIGYTPDLSVRNQKLFQFRDSLLNKEKLTAKEQDTLNKILESYSEVVESIWDVVEGGCSWYCGGGPYKTKSSSSLNNNFSAEKANDLSLQFAWVEGVKGHGEGEYLEYYFKNESPRLNKIHIFNGYVKNDAAWKNNARVKKLKLLINGVPYAILHLKDTKALQTFNVPTLGRTKDKKDLILRFEIVEVYQGLKFEDTALTEIYFDGIDVH